MAPTFVIAEAGVNHNGRLDIAVKLCDAAKQSGADAVKFQTFRAQDLVTLDAPTAEYQQRATGNTTQFEMLQALELDDAAHQHLANHCRAIGLEFMSTPFSIEAVNLLRRAGVNRLKLPSGEITHQQLLQAAAATGLPLIVSTGMATVDEVRTAVAWLRAVPNCSVDLVVLHCTSAYPAVDASLNLRAMCQLRDELGVRVGYSDHSEGAHAALACVALGAEVIEKHITLDKSLPGPDHQASMEVAEFAQLVRDIRRVELMLGDGQKRPTADELRTAALVRRGVYVAKALSAGHTLEADDLVMRRPRSELEPSAVPGLVGRLVRKPLGQGVALQPEDLL